LFASDLQEATGAVEFQLNSTVQQMAEKASIKSLCLSAAIILQNTEGAETNLNR
jgi:hypothetical protein